MDLVRARGDRDDGEGGGVCECDAQRGRAIGWGHVYRMSAQERGGSVTAFEAIK